MRCVLCFLLLTSSALSQDYAVGQKVMPKAGPIEFLPIESQRGLSEPIGDTLRLFFGGVRKVSSARAKYPLVIREITGDMLNVGFARVNKSNVVLLAEAPDYYSQLLKDDPKQIWASHHKAMSYAALGDHDKAISEYTAIVHLYPSMPDAYNSRGIVFHKKDDYDAAIADFTEAIRLSPSSSITYRAAAIAYNNRGSVKGDKGEYESSLADLNKALEINSSYATPYSNRAWIRATAREARFRDGRAAVADATKACEMTNWAESRKMDSLAASYAEAGDYQEAVRHQEAAIAVADEEDKSALEVRLHLYREGKPYRE